MTDLYADPLIEYVQTFIYLCLKAKDQLLQLLVVRLKLFKKSQNLSD